MFASRESMVPERKSLMVSASKLITSSTVLSGGATYSTRSAVTFGHFALPGAGLVGVRMEIAEAAFHRPSSASRTVSGDALPSLSGSSRWLKLWASRVLVEPLALADIADVVTPKTASEVKELLADAMAHVRAGKMDPKLGTTLGYLGTSLLKAIETSDIELRLARLEASSELKDEN